MTTETIISQLTVRLSDIDSGTPIGTAVLYSHPSLKEKVYVITAAHNLFEDSVKFQRPRKHISVEILDPSANTYQTIVAGINPMFVSAEENNDYAVIVLNHKEVLAINPKLPATKVLRNPQSGATFIIKGFPRATQGKELASIRPDWIQSMTASERFQLQLKEDYDSYSTAGFSGSGVFTVSGAEVFLIGLFTRLREEGKGKVIYCQFIYSINEVLERSFQPVLQFSFLGGNQLSPSFFDRHIASAKNQLGPRFNRNFNVEMPVALLFDGLAKNKSFQIRLLKLFDSYLVPKKHWGSEGSAVIEDIEKTYQETKQAISSLVTSIDWSPNGVVNLNEVIKRIDNLSNSAQRKRSELYEKRGKEKHKSKEEKKSHSSTTLYSNEINRLGEIIASNDSFVYGASEVSMRLANHPFLILHGEAGCGKSHLLGDVANERWKQGKPSILLLGQLFKSSSTAWQNIIAQIGIHCNKEELLTWLNSIGQQVNERVLILIDALNEGGGKEIWPDELGGFIEDVSNYPFLGVAVSVRSTYLKIIVSNDIKNRREITLLEHEGFKGNEYEAVKMFCAHYRLEQPNFPLLAPEFSNPLFLWLTCEGIKAVKGKKFPSGFQGVSKLYRSYVDSVIERLTKKRDEYNTREHIIRHAIIEMARLCFFHKDSGWIPLSDAVAYFDKHFAGLPHLLHDLILENLFIQNYRTEYDIDEHTEVLYFAFERLGDYFLAEELLKQYATQEEVLTAFSKGSQLGNLMEESYLKIRGIIEVFAMLLPEKYMLEIFEAYHWIFELAEEDNQYLNNAYWLNHALLDSLKWRTLDSINNEKITAWMSGVHFSTLRDETSLNFLIRMSPVEGHPFNSDRLTNMLKSYSMPQRDGFWQSHIRYYSGVDDRGSGYPIRRLIDWAWQPGISADISTEVARLTGQTLAWLLSSTYIGLRDQTTKAMVNLLHEQPAALLRILDTFKDIDDFYILERLYAVCYGCALRTICRNGLNEIATYVYENIFKDGDPPVHVLLRDYARNVVEYAIYKGAAPKGDMSIIRPPYRSKMPTDIPTEEDLKEYDKDQDDPNLKRNGRYFNKQIIHSVIGWDFGRYTVNSALRDFCPYSFTEEAAIKAFLKELKPDHRLQVKLLQSAYNIKGRLEQRNRKYGQTTILERDQKLIDIANEQIRQTEECLSKILSAEKISFIQHRLKPHIANVVQASTQLRSFDPEPMKRWIVKRAHELGYDPKLHSGYDLSSTYGDRHENKIERIGKKYQWIALHEVIARVADNHKIQKDSWGNSNKYIFYPGSWTGYLRDIDPIFITRNRATGEDFYDSIEVSAAYEWWIERSYSYWSRDSAEWVTLTEDLHNPKVIIQPTDPEGNEWFLLASNIHWREPRPFGKDKYNVMRKEIWYLLQAYFVRKADKNKTIKFLEGKSFWGRWMPESYNAHLSIFNRENYWSPVAQSAERQSWQTLDETNLKVLVATAKAVGEMSNDKSGAHFQYEMPCRLLFENLGLVYSATDGEFQTADGEIVVISPSQSDQTILIKKRFLIKFLEENNLEIVWTLLGEKSAFDGSLLASGDNYLKVINGVYSLNKNIVEGSFRLDDRD